MRHVAPLTVNNCVYFHFCVNAAGRAAVIEPTGESYFSVNSAMKGSGLETCSYLNEGKRLLRFARNDTRIIVVSVSYPSSQPCPLERKKEKLRHSHCEGPGDEVICNKLKYLKIYIHRDRDDSTGMIIRRAVKGV